MTLMLIIIMTSVIALSVLVNLTMLKTYYTVKEKKTIKESYVQLQKIFKKDTVRENEVDEIAKKYNYRIMISNSTGSRAYSSEGQNSVMYKGLWNIMNNNLDKICLLYTSDAADEEDSIYLGGRGIANKKED